MRFKKGEAKSEVKKEERREIREERENKEIIRIGYIVVAVPRKRTRMWPLPHSFTFRTMYKNNAVEVGCDLIHCSGRNFKLPSLQERDLNTPTT